MYADMAEVPEDHPWDQYVVTCPAEDCPLLKPWGPWSYHVTRELVEVPGHGEARFADAEKAWEEHVSVHHPDHVPQHRRRPA